MTTRNKARELSASDRAALHRAYDILSNDGVCWPADPGDAEPDCATCIATGAVADLLGIDWRIDWRTIK